MKHAFKHVKFHFQNSSHHIIDEIRFYDVKSAPDFWYQNIAKKDCRFGTLIFCGACYSLTSQKTKRGTRFCDVKIMPDFWCQNITKKFVISAQISCTAYCA